MTCLASEQLAALASGEGERVAVEHVEACTACADAVRAQRELVALAAQWVPAPMASRRRAELAAEVLASADAPVVHSSRRWLAISGGVAAAAMVAAAAIAIVARDAAEPMETQPQPQAATQLPAPTVPPPAVAAPTVVPAADIASHGAQFTRAQIASLDTVQLRSGELVVDTRDREPARIVAHGAEVSVDHARVAVVARNGVVVSLHVFAGSAELSDRGVHRVIQAGEMWTRPADVAAVAPPPPAERAPAAPPAASASAADSLVAFRDGWQALQAGDNLVAVAAFDRATDPVVAEDATFWAAVAEQRAGRADDAARRLRAFVDAFPDSPRADAARTRLAALGL